MAVAGYSSTISINGISTAFTNEATNDLGNNAYQIADVSKQVFDLDVPVVVEDAGLLVPDSQYEVDYLFGIITFLLARTGPITISGNFVPTKPIIGANSVTLNETVEELNSTSFDETNENGGYSTFVMGLLDATVTIESYLSLDNNFRGIMTDRSRVLVEIKIPNSNLYRGWFLLQSDGLSINVNDLITESLNFRLEDNQKTHFSMRRI